MQVQCTLGYAAPEVVRAHYAHQPLAALPSQDVWALGVMTYEAFAREPAVDPWAVRGHCADLAGGAASYPWEAGAPASAFGGSRARDLVERCLARDPRRRPTAAALVQSLRLISSHA